MGIIPEASYRRLDFSKSREQIQINAQNSEAGEKFDLGKALEIQDYSLRTPVKYEVISEDYLNISTRVNQVTVDLEIDLDSNGPQSKQLLFDKKITEIVLDLFPMTPHEAANRDVWSYITLRVLPGHAAWRYPNNSADPEWERFIGFERNTFKRLWWRAHMLGSDLAVQLQEDDLVQMFERTESIGSNGLLMRTLAQFAIENVDVIRAIGGKSSAIYTETSKSLRRSMAVIGYEAMDEQEFAKYVRFHASETLDRLLTSKDG